jgi:hypothetical protein
LGLVLRPVGPPEGDTVGVNEEEYAAPASLWQHKNDTCVTFL